MLVHSTLHFTLLINVNNKPLNIILLDNGLHFAQALFVITSQTKYRATTMVELYFV